MNIDNIKVLIEGRRRPDINKKTSTLTQLRNIQTTSKLPVFVSFTALNKVGIHPTTKYNTPVGFYCYPLEYILSHPSEMLSLSRPFPVQHNKWSDEGSKYCQVMQLIDDTFVYDVTDDLNQEQKLHIKATLGTYCNTIGDVWKQLYSNTTVNNLVGHEELTVSEIAPKIFIFFRKMGIDCITDLHNTGTIHPKEKTQAVFFNLKVLKHIATLDDKDTLDVDAAAKFGVIHVNAKASEFKHYIKNIFETYENKYDNMAPVRLHGIRDHVVAWIKYNKDKYRWQEYLQSDISDAVCSSMVPPINLDDCDILYDDDYDDDYDDE